MNYIKPAEASALITHALSDGRFENDLEDWYTHLPENIKSAITVNGELDVAGLALGTPLFIESYAKMDMEDFDSLMRRYEENNAPANVENDGEAEMWQMHVEHVQESSLMMNGDFYISPIFYRNFGYVGHIYFPAWLDDNHYWYVIALDESLVGTRQFPPVLPPSNTATLVSVEGFMTGEAYWLSDDFEMMDTSSTRTLTNILTGFESHVVRVATENLLTISNAELRQQISKGSLLKFPSELSVVETKNADSTSE